MHLLKKKRRKKKDKNKKHRLDLMVGMLCSGPVLSSNTRWERYWLRSPLSMYSVTMHRGSLLTHTPSNRIIFGSFRRDKIFTSFRKSFLQDGRQGKVTTTAVCVSHTDQLCAIILCWKIRWLGKKKKNRCIEPGVFRGIRPQNLHSYQQRASFPHVERELEIGEVLRVFNLTQMNLRGGMWTPCC